MCGATLAVLAAFVLLRAGSSNQETAVSTEAAHTTTTILKEAGQFVDPASTALPSPVSTLPTDAPPSRSAGSAGLPANSGSGKRMVLSISQQRVWWVDESGTEIRTALVSGRANTPQTGTFKVYSRTEHATGLDGSKMDYFVRFTKGPQGWSIGFHNIPRINGQPVQTNEQLGQTLSHGCIRQKEEDAVFTWNFLDIGSTVVVIA